MNKRELRRLEFSKRKYDVLPDNEELKRKVEDIEDIISQPHTIWTDDEKYNKYQKILSLSLSDRRLLIVYSITGTINRTAKLFNVDRATVANNIERIKKELGI